MSDIRMLPDNWTNWQITEMIGEGSYGVVYRAERKAGDRTVTAAIKVVDIPSEENEAEHMLKELSSRDSVRQYYKDIVDDYIHEIQIMDALKGITNIVSIEDYCIQEQENGIGWTIFIRMELLTNIKDYFIEHPQTEEDVIRIGIDICTALEYCEKESILHRDIKPDNIFRSSHGNYKLGDFGEAKQLSRSLSHLSMRGTLSYMAPEVAGGKDYDKTADIYSLGLVLYRLLNNNRDPFVDPWKQLVSYSDREAALRRRMAGEKLPPPAKASDELAQVILMMAAYSPAERFQNAGVCKTALELVRDGKGASALPRQSDEKRKEALNEKAAARKPIQELPAESPHSSNTLRWIAVIFILIVLVISGAMLFQKKLPGNRPVQNVNSEEDNSSQHPIQSQGDYDGSQTTVSNEKGELDINGTFYSSDHTWRTEDGYLWCYVTIYNRTDRTTNYNQYTEKIEIELDDGSKRKVTLVFELPSIGAGEKKTLTKKVDYETLKIEDERTVINVSIVDESFS